MSILDLFKRRKKGPDLPIFPKSQIDPPISLLENLPVITGFALWNDPDGIHLSSQHISSPGTYIICDVKYIPTGRSILCRVRTPDESNGEFTRLTVPQEIRTVPEFLAFTKTSGSGAWFMQGYTMPEAIQIALSRVL